MVPQGPACGTRPSYLAWPRAHDSGRAHFFHVDARLGPGAPLLGRGEGQLAAGTFLGASLIVAGMRADPGCEVMAIPGALFGKHTELACLVFSPLDWLERKWRSKRAA